MLALFLISIGILGLASLQPSAWRLSGRSDYLGRAAGILQNQLEANEMLLMNPSYPNPCTLSNPVVTSTWNEYTSGKTQPQQGDATFTVQRTITYNSTDNNWLVRIRVTWPNNTTGISETTLVGQQASFLPRQ